VNKLDNAVDAIMNAKVYRVSPKSVSIPIAGESDKEEATNVQSKTVSHSDVLESLAFNIYTRTKWGSLLTLATGCSSKSKNKSVLKQIKSLWTSSSQTTKEKYLSKARL